MEYVWVIEKGSYSDYRVCGVYDSQEKAERVAEWLNAEDASDEATVAKWPLNPGADALNAGMHQYIVHMLRDGTVEKVYLYDSRYSLGDECGIWRRSQAIAYRGKNIQDCINATVWATDEKHAVKIVNERRTQMIALGEWA